MKKLRRSLNELFENGRRFFDGLAETDKVLLIYHRDLDGVSSVVLLLTALEKIRPMIKFQVATNDDFESVLNLAKDYNKIIVLDVDVSYMKEKLKTLNKEILMIDHHPPRVDMNDKKIIYINPRLENPEIYQPASYITYKFLSQFTDMREKEWIAVIGTASDFGFEDCQDLLKNWIKIKTKKEFWETKIGKIVIEINAAASIIGFNEMVEMILESKSLEELIKNRKILNSSKEFNKEFKRCKKEFERNAERIGVLVISEIESKYKRISSSIVTELSTKNPDKIFIVMERVDDKYNLHCRHQSGRVHLGKLMEKCCEGLNGGGGHKQAAGGTISSGKKDVFKERLIKELESGFLNESK